MTRHQNVLRAADNREAFPMPPAAMPWSSQSTSTPFTNGSAASSHGVTDDIGERGVGFSVGVPQRSSCHHLFRGLLWCLYAAVVLAHPAHATLIASSKITRCSTSGNETFTCAKKMTVSLTVEAGQLAGEESVLFISSASDETTASGTSNGPTVTFSPLRVTTSRSAVRYRYPLFYTQNYNAKPFEATVKGKLLNQCNADLNPNTATCGVAYGSDGHMIPYSQGFCCDCSMCQTLGFCAADARANKACNIFDAFTTASCLRFGQRWYSGYTIGAYITWFTLNVTVSRNTTTASGSETGTGIAAEVVTQRAVMELSPSTPGDTASDGWGVAARIVGSFAPNDQPLDLTSHMLFAPALPVNDARVKAGALEWMLLPTTLVTLDGRECNKVGVSYEGFASQGNRCNLNPGSCLNSQLEDYRTSDLARVAAGRKTQYMAAGYGDFALERITNATGNSVVASQTSPYISYIAASPAATMITLTVNADDLMYIVAVAQGLILSATMNKGTLEASTADGVLQVVVKNVADVTGRLVVEISNCTSGVFPISAQILSLAPQQQSSLHFHVYMQDSFASGRAQCTVAVRNAEEAVTDSRLVVWDVAATGFSNGTQGGSTNGGTGGFTEESSAATCDRCGVLDIVCAAKRTCWSLALLDVVVYALIAGGALGVFWFRHILCCCFYHSCTPEDQRECCKHNSSPHRSGHEGTHSWATAPHPREHFANTTSGRPEQSHRHPRRSSERPDGVMASGCVPIVHGPTAVYVSAPVAPPGNAPVRTFPFPSPSAAPLRPQPAPSSHLLQADTSPCPSVVHNAGAGPVRHPTMPPGFQTASGERAPWSLLCPPHSTAAAAARERLRGRACLPHQTGALNTPSSDPAARLRNGSVRRYHVYDEWADAACGEAGSRSPSPTAPYGRMTYAPFT